MTKERLSLPAVSTEERNAQGYAIGENGVKMVHSVILAGEGVYGDIKFTSAATCYSFMLTPTNLSEGDVVAIGQGMQDYLSRAACP